MRRVTPLAVIVTCALAAWSLPNAAQAQSGTRPSTVLSTGSAFGYNRELLAVRNQARARRAPSIRSVSRIGGGIATNVFQHQPNSKPHANIERRSTISPYLNLERFNEDAFGLPNYFTFVRPQLEQDSVNRRQQQNVRQLSGRVDEVQSSALDPLGQSELPSTGHPTSFMNFSHYYSFR